MYFVEKGKLEMFIEMHKKEKEKENHTIKEIGPGEVFGHFSFFTGQ